MQPFLLVPYFECLPLHVARISPVSDLTGRMKKSQVVPEEIVATKLLFQFSNPEIPSQNNFTKMCVCSQTDTQSFKDE